MTSREDLILAIYELQTICVFEPSITKTEGETDHDLERTILEASKQLDPSDPVSKKLRKVLKDVKPKAVKPQSNMSEKKDNIHPWSNIFEILKYIGEDPERDGLKDTPNRVVKSYSELFSGYGKDPKELFTTFQDDKYDQMVILKDIELYSMCEHHMLPFYGKAHVAYIPYGGKVIGISKLARLVDLFARRLQIQERIGNQVTAALDEFLAPEGAACVIEASHMCMQMRGVGKQHSVMTTSSLTGVFKKDPAVRQEFMNLIAKS